MEYRTAATPSCRDRFGEPPAGSGEKSGQFVKGQGGENVSLTASRRPAARATQLEGCGSKERADTRTHTHTRMHGPFVLPHLSEVKHVVHRGRVILPLGRGQQTATATPQRKTGRQDDEVGEDRRQNGAGKGCVRGEGWVRATNYAARSQNDTCDTFATGVFCRRRTGASCAALWMGQLVTSLTTLGLSLHDGQSLGTARIVGRPNWIFGDSCTKEVHKRRRFRVVRGQTGSSVPRLARLQIARNAAGGRGVAGVSRSLHRRTFLPMCIM